MRRLGGRDYLHLLPPQRSVVANAAAPKWEKRAQPVLLPQDLAENTPADRARVLRRFSARRALILRRLRVIFGVQSAAVGAANAQNTHRTRAQTVWMPQKLAQNTPAERVRVLRRFSARRALILRRMRSVCA